MRTLPKSPSPLPPPAAINHCSSNGHPTSNRVASSSVWCSPSSKGSNSGVMDTGDMATELWELEGCIWGTEWGAEGDRENRGRAARGEGGPVGFWALLRFRNVVREFRRLPETWIRGYVAWLSSRGYFIGDVRGPAIVPALGCNCSFSRIRSAALDFRTGSLGTPGSLRLMDDVRITSEVIEMCVGAVSRGWLQIQARDWCPSDCGEAVSVDGEEFEKLDTLTRATGDNDSCPFVAGSSGSNIGHRCTLRRKPWKRRRQVMELDITFYTKLTLITPKLVKRRTSMPKSFTLYFSIHSSTVLPALSREYRCNSLGQSATTRPEIRWVII